jgi:serine/threonine protein kinase
MAMSLPKPFGKYLLERRIAVGGMAEIYLAKSLGAEGFQRDVVIKLILASYSEDEAFVTMFIDEARIAARLHHANIIQIHDFDKFDDSYYIAMEYVEGRDLRKVMDRSVRAGRRMPVLQAVQIAAEISAGLKYAHTRKDEAGRPLDIIHRDVSPHNVLLSFGGDVKITDFGIAKAAARSTKTRAGTVKGKCSYMSPEQARGKPLDGRSDLFAVCAILWELLTGRKAFDGDTDFGILSNVLSAAVPPPSQFNPDVPPELDAIVLKGLRKDREERFLDMAALEKELRAFAFRKASGLEELSVVPFLQELFADDIDSEASARSGAAAEPPAPARASREASSPGTLVLPESEADAVPEPFGFTPSPRAADPSLPTTIPVGQLREEMETLLASRATPPGAGSGAPGPVALPEGEVPTVSLDPAGRSSTPTPHAPNPAPRPVDRPSSPAAARADGTGSRPELRGTKTRTVVLLGAAGAVLALGLGAWLVLSPGGDDGTPPARQPARAVAVESPDAGPSAARDAGIAAAPDASGADAGSPRPGRPAVAAAPAPKVPLEVEVYPASATVKVDGEVVPGRGGRRVLEDRFAAGDVVVVTATAPGRHEASQKVTLSGPREVVRLRLDLAGTAPAPRETGFVTINARPWADVLFRGRKLGTTPLNKVEVPVGAQTFLLRNASTTRQVTVTVEKGKTVVAPLQNM